MLDLHIHTNNSDGTSSTLDVLKEAQNSGLYAISITDHNTCEAYEELKGINIADYYTGKIISGCEFNTSIMGIGIELLGYNVDTDYLNKILPNEYKVALTDKNMIQAKILINICNELGIIIDKEVIDGLNKYRYATDEIFKNITIHPENKKHFKDDVWNYGSIENGNLFYREYLCNPDSEFFISSEPFYPKVEEVTGYIKDAGGLVFIPHIFEYKNNAIKILETLLENYEIDGIECYYSLFEKEETEYILKLCKDRDLLISGGSDYHGGNKPYIKIGTGKGTLNVPDHIISNWAEFIL